MHSAQRPSGCYSDPITLTKTYGSNYAFLTHYIDAWSQKIYEPETLHKIQKDGLLSAEQLQQRQIYLNPRKIITKLMKNPTAADEFHNVYFTTTPKEVGTSLQVFTGEEEKPEDYPGRTIGMLIPKKDHSIYNLFDRFSAENLSHASQKNNPYYQNSVPLSKYKGNFPATEIIIPHKVDPSKLIFEYPSKEEEQKIRDRNTARQKKANENLEIILGPSLRSFHTVLNDQFELTPEENVAFERASAVKNHVESEIEHQKEREEWARAWEEGEKKRQKWNEESELGFKALQEEEEKRIRNRTPQEVRREANERNIWSFGVAFNNSKNQKKLETNPHNKYPEID